MAGIPGRARLTDTSLEQWERVFNVNVTSLFMGMKVFISGLLEVGQPGAIVNISSVSRCPDLTRSRQRRG